MTTGRSSGLGSSSISSKTWRACSTVSGNEGFCGDVAQPREARGRIIHTSNTSSRNDMCEQYNGSELERTAPQPLVDFAQHPLLVRRVPGDERHAEPHIRPGVVPGDGADQLLGDHPLAEVLPLLERHPLAVRGGGPWGLHVQEERPLG